MDVPLPDNKRPGNKRSKHTVRLMAPFSMRCSHCSEFIYKGRKFNARKENVEERYLSSIRVFRFYIRCPRCSGEICYKTDPENADYVCEKGAVRNFEPFRAAATAATNGGGSSGGFGESNTSTTNDDHLNPMTLLEKQTITHKKELSIIEDLQRFKDKNDRLEALAVDVGADGGGDPFNDNLYQHTIIEPIAKPTSIPINHPEDDLVIREAFLAIPTLTKSTSTTPLSTNAKITKSKTTSALLEKMKKIRVVKKQQ